MSDKSIDEIDFERVVALVSKYEQRKKSGEIKRLGEADTREDFISPLFKALGWNMENDLNRNDSVSKEENIAGKRSDYSFRINGIPKFFLEAKSLKEENIQTNSEYVKQAINYAWMKSCSWAVLCNFETIAVYNADWKDSNYGNNVLFIFHPGDFLTNPKFKMLSKKSFENNELDTYAKVNYKKQLKYRIDKQLLQDMIHFREVLSKDIVRNNQDKHLNQDNIDESVQRILDRLIFIRNAEDRGLEGNRIQSVVRQWYEKGKGHLVKEISGIYKEYDDKYNSKLFAHHLCDDLYIGNEPLQEAIEGLNHSKDNSYRYDFSIIESDVLGNIYEQYLGNVLKSTPKRAKLEESKTHRKEQGIYYTPSYIVDYIVKNTVGEFIKTHSPEEIRKVRILDPACGSGSFLIRAYKELEEYWSKYYEKNKEISESARTVRQTKFNTDMEGNEIEFYSTKTEILKNNIFGVDLDPKAVEIAQLNLLLQISERKHRLPLLQNNIKVGNSLIDDPSVSDRAFKWEEEFPEIMKEGGFDIVIGNPPYIRMQSLNKNETEYFNKIYYSSEKNYDIYMLFIERGFKQLKQRGELGFILPHKFFEGENGTKIRQFISDSKSLDRIINFNTNQIFESATTYTCLLFLNKTYHKKFYYKEYNLGENFRTLDNVNFEIRDVESLGAEPWNFTSEQASKILTKIRTNGISFSDITRKIFKGSSTGNDDVFLLDIVQIRENTTTVYSKYLKQDVEIENELLKQFLYGEDIRRYQVPVSHKMLLFPYYKSKGKLELIPPELMQSKYPKAFRYLNDVKKELLKRKVKVVENEFYKYSAGRSLSEYEQPKIMIPDMLVKNRVGYDERGIYYHGPAIHSVLFNELAKDVDPLLYLAVLNSKIFWFFITQTSTALRGDTYRLTPEFLRPFPFPRLDLTDVKNDQEYQEIIRMVKEIISLNTKLLQIQDKRTDGYNEIESQIVKIDSEIDNKIYSLYDITDSEIELIESMLSQ
jgi:type I restriction-modification system DNA methylase subunit